MAFYLPVLPNSNSVDGQASFPISLVIIFLEASLAPPLHFFISPCCFLFRFLVTTLSQLLPRIDCPVSYNKKQNSCLGPQDSRRLSGCKISKPRGHQKPSVLCIFCFQHQPPQTFPFHFRGLIFNCSHFDLLLFQCPDLHFFA